MGKVMRHTLGASLNIRHNLSSSKGPKPLQLKLLTTYIPKTSAFTLAFSTSQRLRTTRASARKIGRAVQQECRDRYRMPSSAGKKKSSERQKELCDDHHRQANGEDQASSRVSYRRPCASQRGP